MAHLKPHLYFAHGLWWCRSPSCLGYGPDIELAYFSWGEAITMMAASPPERHLERATWN